MTIPHVYLFDPFQMTRQLVAFWFQQQSNFPLDLVGQSSEEQTAIQDIARLKPELVIVGVSLSSPIGIELIQRIRKLHSPLHIIVLSDYREISFLRQVFKAGATAYVLKQSSCEVLLASITAVCSGHHYVDPEVSGLLISTYITSDVAPGTENGSSLTKREMDVLNKIVAGYSSREISNILGLSAKTIDTYRARLMGKLGVRSRAELLRCAFQLGLVEEAFQPMDEPPRPSQKLTSDRSEIKSTTLSSY